MSRNTVTVYPTTNTYTSDGLLCRRCQRRIEPGERCTGFAHDDNVYGANPVECTDCFDRPKRPYLYPADAFVSPVVRRAHANRLPLKDLTVPQLLRTFGREVGCDTGCTCHGQRHS
jgi:hypothetical protein